jgi:hypothetical protein
MHFILRKVWFCQFLEEDLKTALPKTIRFTDDKKIWEMARRGGFTLDISGRKGTGGAWLGAYAGAVCEAAEAIMRVLHRRSVVFTI